MIPEPPLDPPEEPVGDVVPPTREDGPAWTSPEDGHFHGWPDGRYIVAFILDGIATEDSRKQTISEARERRYLLGQELNRRGHSARVVIWDAEDPERGDLVPELEINELGQRRRKGGGDDAERG